MMEDSDDSDNFEFQQNGKVIDDFDLERKATVVDQIKPRAESLKQTTGESESLAKKKKPKVFEDSSDGGSEKNLAFDDEVIRVEETNQIEQQGVPDQELKNLQNELEELGNKNETK